MLKYIIYLAVAVLVLWAVWYVARSVRRQAKGECSACAGGCSGNCSGCASSGHCATKK